MSLVYLPPHLERSQPFPRVGHQVSSPDTPQEMSWQSYSYTRSTVPGTSDDQQLYPAMNRLSGPYPMPFYTSPQYMERESSQSQCTLQSNAPFAHDGLDLSNRPPVPRRRTREDSDSASVSGSAPYGPDSNQVCMRKCLSFGLFYNDCLLFFVFRSMVIISATLRNLRPHRPLMTCPTR